MIECVLHELGHELETTEARRVEEEEKSRSTLEKDDHMLQKNELNIKLWLETKNKYQLK